MSTKLCPRCGGGVWMVEYSLTDKYHYDGVSEYKCKDDLCGWRIGRFCEQELAPGEVEPPHHQGGTHPRVFSI